MKFIVRTFLLVLLVGLAPAMPHSVLQAQVNRPAGGQGRPQPSARPAQRPSTSARPAQRSSTSTASNRPGAASKTPSASGAGGKYPGQRDVSKPSGTGGGGHNRVNIDNSRGDVNINIDNSKDVRIHNQRNTVVRHNPPGYYHRPPYYWGGHRYYCYHPYVYHPYTPFYWGPVWHSWGFFVATLAATAVVVSVNNAKYHYDQGVWYEPSNGGYTVVQAPVGGSVTSIPSGSQTVVVNNTTNYYYGGAYYEKEGGSYTVVPPQAGAVVDNLPEGGEEVKIGDQTYVKYGETYYAPVQVDGKDKYEVVQVEDGQE